MGESGQGVYMDHRIDHKEGNKDRKVFCSGPYEGQDHEGGHGHGLHELDGRFQDLACQGLPEGQGAGQETRQEGHKKSQADAAEGKPEG